MLSSFEKKFLKKLYRFCNFQILKKLLKVHGVTSPKKWVQFWEFFGKFFLKFENFFFEICTTVYKQV